MTSRILARSIRRLVIAGAVAGIGGLAVAATGPAKAQMTSGYCVSPPYGANCQYGYGYGTPPLNTRWPGPSPVFQPPH